MVRERDCWGQLHTPPMRSESAGTTMPAVMASTISRGILKQRRRRRVVPWLGRELITERRIQPPDTVTEVRVNAVRHPKTQSKRKSELLEHVARSIAFEIPRGTIRTVPFTATVFCSIVGGCRFRASRNKSQLEAHTQRRTTRRSDVCLDEVNVSPVTWRPGCVFQHGDTPANDSPASPVINQGAYMQRQLKRRLSRLRSASVVQRGRWPPRAMNTPTVAKRARVARRCRLLPSWRACPALLHSCGRDVDVAGGRGLCKQARKGARHQICLATMTSRLQRVPWQECARIGD